MFSEQLFMGPRPARADENGIQLLELLSWRGRRDGKRPCGIGVFEPDVKFGPGVFPEPKIVRRLFCQRVEQIVVSSDALPVPATFNRRLPWHQLSVR
jgi:hypothetical protein